MIDPNVVWLLIKDGIIYCRDNALKLKTFNVKEENKTPWFTKSLVKLVRIRNKLYKIALASLPGSLAWSAFKTSRDHFKSSFRRAKASHFMNILINNDCDWSHFGFKFTLSFVSTKRSNLFRRFKLCKIKTLKNNYLIKYYCYLN